MSQLPLKYLRIRTLTCCGWFGFKDFDVRFCGLQCFAFELRLQRSPHRVSADSGVADVAAGRTRSLAAC